MQTIDRRKFLSACTAGLGLAGLSGCGTPKALEVHSEVIKLDGARLADLRQYSGKICTLEGRLKFIKLDHQSDGGMSFDRFYFRYELIPASGPASDEMKVFVTEELTQVAGQTPPSSKLSGGQARVRGVFRVEPDGSSCYVEYPSFARPN